MKEIIIPILNLKLNINPIAFYVFGIPIYWYAILIVASIILALFLMKIRSNPVINKSKNTFGIYYDDIIDLALILIPISFICARVYYVLFSLDYYTTLWKIINIKDGGIAIYGGIIGGIITTYYFCKKRKISFLDLADYIIPYLSLRTSNRKMGKFYK